MPIAGIGVQHRSVSGHPYDARMPDIQQLVRSIDGRLAEARKEIVSLETALASLSGQLKPAGTRRTSRATKSETSSPKAAPAPSRPSPSTSGSAPKLQAQSPKQARTQRAKPAKRPEVVPAGKLEKLLGASDGLTTTILAEQSSDGRDQVLNLLREMEATGRIRRTGERRGTRWHLITDEDRIATRAAELEAQSKRTRARKN
jgi:hypothetical protein